jgi:hypothetical protein
MIGRRMEWLRDWLLDDPRVRVPLTLTALGVLLVLPLAGFAVYLWRMASRVMAERVFPPSGYTVLRRQPPITGDAAMTYARLGRFFALLILVAALVLVLQLWRLAVVIGA